MCRPRFTDDRRGTAQGTQVLLPEDHVDTCAIVYRPLHRGPRSVVRGSSLTAAGCNPEMDDADFAAGSSIPSHAAVPLVGRETVSVAAVEVDRSPCGLLRPMACRSWSESCKSEDV